MSQIDVVLNQIFILGIIAVLAYFAVKTDYISGDIKDYIGKLIVRVTMPLLVITSLTNGNVTHESLMGGLVLVGVAYLSLAIMFAIGYGSSRIMRLEGQPLIINTCISMFGNVIFLGYPLIKAVYGSEGLFYAILFSICSDSLCYTLGIYNMSKGQGEATFRRLINPNTVSFLVAITMMLLGIKIINPLGTALVLVGNATTPLSMIFIGAVLASVNIKEIYKKYSLYLAATVKLLINPLLIILLVAFLPISPVIKGVVVLQVAMPSQTMLSVLAKEYGSDYIYATEGIFVTTLFSLITLPVVYYIFCLIKV